MLDKSCLEESPWLSKQKQHFTHYYLQFIRELNGNRRGVINGISYLCSLEDCWPQCFDRALGCCCPVQ